jgi:hypothetical protein
MGFYVWRFIVIFAALITIITIECWSKSPAIAGMPREYLESEVNKTGLGECISILNTPPG